MKTKNMILVLSIIVCMTIAFATPVLADAWSETNENTVYIQDSGKNNTTNNTVIIQDSKSDLPNTGSTEDYIFIGIVVTCIVIAVYSYKKITDYKNL